MTRVSGQKNAFRSPQTKTKSRQDVVNKKVVFSPIFGQLFSFSCIALDMTQNIVAIFHIDGLSWLAGGQFNRAPTSKWWSAQLVSSEVLPVHPMFPLAASREWWDTLSAGRYYGILDDPCSHYVLPRNSGTLHDVPMGNRTEY